MNKRTLYVVPQADILRLEPEQVLNMSGFGSDNAPGQSFDTGNTLDLGDF